MGLNYQNIKLRQQALRKFASNSYIGPQLNFTHMYDVHFESLDEKPLPPPAVTGSEGSTNLGVGVLFNWDKRDNILTPSKNHFVELSALVYSTRWQSDFSFSRPSGRWGRGYATISTLPILPTSGWTTDSEKIPAVCISPSAKHSDKISSNTIVFETTKRSANAGN